MFFSTLLNFSSDQHSEAKEVSLHPPHLVASSGSLTPAALIPFCAYQTNMTLLGQTKEDLPFTVCSTFKPTVLEGQLCYSLDLSTLKTNRSKAGKRYGLLLLIDPGIDDKKQESESKQLDQKFTSLNLETVSGEQSFARIYINTLASFSDNRAGSYAMSVLKRMTGTEGFLELTDKGCQIENFEDCQAKRYVKEVQKQCDCVPWAWSHALSIKVR